MPRVSDVSMNSVTFRLSASLHLCMLPGGLWRVLLGQDVMMGMTIVLAMLPSLAQCSCKMFRYVSTKCCSRGQNNNRIGLPLLWFYINGWIYPQYATMQNAMIIN